ncbi:hypothetical protein [Marinobacter sp.]|uniref:hypothetical protein n=1 Tax=Marinobacter sp. TaxID=50741 RepID=UPI003A8DB87E
MNLQQGLRQETYAVYLQTMERLLGADIPVVESAGALDAGVLVQVMARAPSVIPGDAPKNLPLPAATIYAVAQVRALAITLQGDDSGDKWLLRSQSWLGGISPFEALAMNSIGPEPLLVRLVQSAEGYVL